MRGAETTGRPGDRSGAPGARRREIGLAATAACGALLLFTALTLPFLDGRVPVAGDLGMFHLPLRHFFARALAQGDTWLWFPGQFSGHYLQGEGQVGMTHPLQQILYRTLPLEPAFALEALRAWLMGFAGAFLLLRRLDLRLDASALGALLVAFAPFGLLQFTHLNCVGILAHAPWMLLASELALRGERARHRHLAALGQSLLVASMLLLAHPQYTWLVLLVTALSPLAFTRGAGSPAPAPGVRPRRLVLLVTAVALGFLLAAIQLVPHLDMLRESFRRTPSSGFVDSYAVPLSHLTVLLDPWLFRWLVPTGASVHETAPWPGVLALPLALWLMAARRSVGTLWPVARWALGIAALGLVLSLGDSGGINRLLRALPLIGLFRAPGRYLFLFHLGLALAAAIAFDRLARSSEGTIAPGRTATAVVWLPGLLSFGVAMIWLLGPSVGVTLPFASLVAAPARALAGPLLLLAAAAGIGLAARGRTTAGLALLIGLAVTDAATYGVARVLASPTATAAELGAAALPSHLNPAGRIAWATLGATIPGERLAGGYAALAPERVLGVGAPGADLTAPELAQAARVAGVSHSASGKALPTPLPRARLVAAARVSTDPARDLADGTVDPATTVLLAETGLAVLPELDPNGPAGTATIERDRPGEIQLATDAPGRRLLVVSEAWHAGWAARVDGNEVELLRAYGDYMACPVPAGQHHVELRFEPWSWRLGSALSGAGIGLALLWLAAAVLAPTRRPAPSEKLR